MPRYLIAVEVGPPVDEWPRRSEWEPPSTQEVVDYLTEAAHPYTGQPRDGWAVVEIVGVLP